MNNLSQVLDITVFVVFFILSIVVGYRYRGKKSSFREYAAGDKKFSTPVLVATIVATWMSGSLLFIDLEQTYKKGLYYIMLALIGRGGGLLLTGRVIGPRMGKFLNNVSVPDVLGQLYGKHVQFITGTCIVLSRIGYVALQFNVISKILVIIFDYSGPEITAIVGTVIILYSTSGGVKAVTFTDVLQFFTFGTLLPVLALAIWNNIADHSQVVHVLNANPLFSFREVLQWSPEFWDSIVLMCYFIFPQLPPQLFQRMVMARDVDQVKHSMTYATVICLAVELCTMWIAILVLADNSSLISSELMSYTVKRHTAWGLGGFVGVGVVALAMSTADSALNAGAVIFANDVWAPLKGEQEGSLKAARWATMGIGFSALLLALKVKGLLKLLLLSANFYMPVVAIPMLMAIFGFQTSRRVALMAMGTGATVVLACLAYFKSVNSFFPGMLANLVVLLGAHYLLGEKGGWGNNPISGDEAALRKKTWQELFADIRAFDLPFYLERTLPMQEYFYSLFGFYIFTAAYTSFYLLPQEVMVQYSFVYELLQYSVTILTTIFLAFPIWPTALQQKRFMAWAWPLTLCYALFVVGGTMVVISGFATPQLLILMLNFIMAVLLLHWPMAVGMGVLGIVIVVAVAQYFLKPGIGFVGDYGTLQFGIVYGLLLGSSFLIALFRHKESYQNLHLRNMLLSNDYTATRGELLKALQHENRFFTEMTTAGQEVLAAISNKVAQFKQKASHLAAMDQLPAATQSMEEVKVAFENTMDYLRTVVYRVQEHVRLNVGEIPFKELIPHILDIVKASTKAPAKPIILQNHLETSTIQCDVARIQQLLMKGMLFALDHNTAEEPILLDLQRTQLRYPLPSLARTKKVAAVCITITNERIVPDVKKVYDGTLGNEPFELPTKLEELTLVENTHIVNAHYGSAMFKQSEAGITQIYVIPLQLREVRPKMMDIPEMEVGGMGQPLQDVLPEETALLERLRQETQVDMDLVEKAIGAIKKYHASVKRKSGEPFYLHPIAATDILLSYCTDPEAILAALLHDTVEDTVFTLAEMGVVFGTGVAAIVNKVTHLDGQLHRVKMDTLENLQQLLEEQDKRVLQVKLADRLHNMRTIGGHPSLQKQKKVAAETLQFFVPIARYLGIEEVTKELLALCDAVLQTEAQ